MKSITLRRLGAAAIAPALAAGMLVAAPSAQAAPTTQPQSAAATWLAAQVDNANHLFVSESEYGPFTDYGLNLDIYAALSKLGQGAAAEQVYDATIAKANDFTTSTYEGATTTYAGAVAKLAVAVQAHDGTADAVIPGRPGLIVELESYVDTASPKKGLVTSGEGDYPNTITQSLAVQALSTADSDKQDEAAEYLLKQQCDDGSFRENMADVQCTTGTPSVDSTAYAIRALTVAAAEGENVPSASITRAADWLAGTQAADGSFEGASGPNTNSTGLAAASLVLADRTAPARKAAQWIAEHQVVLGPDCGAIALEDADSASADGGIDRLDRDRYVRASVQAVLGLTELQGTDGAFAAKSANRFARAGAKTTLRATGLQPAEKFTATIAGGNVVRGRADAAGRATAVLKAPPTAGTRTVTIFGAHLGRQGVARVTVLAARKLPTAIRSTKITKKARQKVAARGLRPGEPYQIRYRGKRVAKGLATSAGRVVRTFNVGGSKGRKHVYVYGLFTGRKGVKSFTVR